MIDYWTMTILVYVKPQKYSNLFQEAQKQLLYNIMKLKNTQNDEHF